MELEARINIFSNARDRIGSSPAFSRLRAFFSQLTLSRQILFIALGGGLFLRIWQINAMGYNTDEAVYAGQAAAIAGVEDAPDPDVAEVHTHQVPEDDVPLEYLDSD